VVDHGTAAELAYGVVCASDVCLDQSNKMRTSYVSDCIIKIL
jgi:hypothetical protein